jgi:DNA-binding GntR family transcriptional regulator
MSAIEPASSQNLHEAIFQKLRSLLVEGKIAPGSKLNERELAERLHVSRTPIREAIRRLAADGLVELIANRGAIAVQLSLEDVIHTFDVIADLEGFSGELAANNITNAALSELEALQYEMMASYARRDLSSYYKLNLRIHHLINQAANNPVLSRLFSQVNARIEALRFRSNQDGVKWERAVEEHQEMLDALKAHDSKRMRKIMMQHVMNKRDVVVQLLQSEAMAIHKTNAAETSKP